MAKAKKRVKRKGGPYLAAAFFCDATIEDKQDGTLSAIRIIDQVTIRLLPSTPPNLPSEQEKLPVFVHGLLAFRTGNSPGEHALRLVMHAPSGKSATLAEQSLPFSPHPHGGANFRLNGMIKVVKGGLFWMDVFLDGKRMARMPLQITIERTEAVSPPAEPTGDTTARSLPSSDTSFRRSNRIKS
jgi:hypothetical protein